MNNRFFNNGVANLHIKLSYLKSCLKAHNHNTCIPSPQTGCTAQKWHSLLLVRIAKQKTVLAANHWANAMGMVTTIIIDYN